MRKTNSLSIGITASAQRPAALVRNTAQQLEHAGHLSKFQAFDATSLRFLHSSFPFFPFLPIIMSNFLPASSPRSTFFSLSPAHSGALTQPSPPNSFSKDPFLVFESPPTKSMLRNASPKAFTPSGNAAAAPSNNSSESLSDGSTYVAASFCCKNAVT